MPPRPTKPKSMFLGPHYRFFNVPFPGTVTVQFYDLLPGDLWNPVDGARALQPFVLPPRPDIQAWHYVDAKFSIGFVQRFDRIRLQGTHRVPFTGFFTLDLFLGVFTPAYNLVQDGTNRFAYAGTATLSWSGVQPE